MSSNKRRRVDSPEPPKVLTAFQARQQAQAAQASQIPNPAPEPISAKSAYSKVQDELLEGPSFTEAAKLSSRFRAGLNQMPSNGNADDDAAENSPYDVNPEEVEASLAKKKSRVSTSKQIPFSTVKPEAIVRESVGKMRVTLGPGERLVVLGEYEMHVVRGKVSLLGATLINGSECHRIYATSSHSLPVIRYLEGDYSDNNVMVRISQLHSGLRDLKKLSPLYAKIWNESATVLPGDNPEQKERSSFQVLFSENDGPKKMLLQQVSSPPEWNEAMAAAATGKWDRDNKQPIIMVCGPKSSGKSTFTKLLTNKLLIYNTPVRDILSTAKPPGIALLDLDPGQPEYSPPGQLSLLHIQKPNFGPPFSHPSAEQVVDVEEKWSHSVCAITPSQDPEHYMACVLDLLNHAKQFLSGHKKCPLIINTPGWVLGTGLELLLELIKNAKPTAVVYMSTEGPADVVKALQDECGKTTKLIQLPSQTSEFTSRTAAQLRVMQTMAYFHLNQKKQKHQFNNVPLSHVPPWIVKYDGKNKGITGIMFLGETPAPEMIKEAINGTLVSVVIIDDKFEEQYAETLTDRGLKPQPALLKNEVGIPYFRDGYGPYFDPKKSRCIGVALIRGVDTENKTLQLLTPIAPLGIKIFSHHKRLALVSGKLETPGWAYTEELHRQAAVKHSARLREKGELADASAEEDEDEGDGAPVEGWEEVPWVERVEGHQGRGVGARVWKVRRDLGRGDA